MKPPVGLPENSDASLPEFVDLETLDHSFRLRPIDPAHVERLAAVLERCPAILVQAGTRLLLDGHMRVAAARTIGTARLPVRWCTGDEAEAVEASLSANATHGQPLTTAERVAGAVTLLGLRPGWSNARIARAAGVSESTVRRNRPAPSSTNLDGHVRLGSDGKRYPAAPDRRAAHLAALLTSEPDLSDRAIARMVGVSPTTVGIHRARLTRSSEPTPATDAARPRRWFSLHARLRRLFHARARFLVRRWLGPRGQR